MKITQMKFQNIVVKVTVILAAISALYAVAIFASPFFQHTYVYSYLEMGAEMDATGYYMFENIQPFNRTLFTVCLIYLLVSLTLIAFFAQSRRNYYLSNVITISVTAIYGLIVSVFSLVNIFSYRGEYAGIDFASINNNEMWIEDKMRNVSTSTWSFDVGIVIYVLIAIFSVLLILNMFWKLKNMKVERQTYAEIDAEIRESWARKEKELAMEAEKFEELNEEATKNEG